MQQVCAHPHAVSGLPVSNVPWHTRSHMRPRSRTRAPPHTCTHVRVRVHTAPSHSHTHLLLRVNSLPMNPSVTCVPRPACFAATATSFPVSWVIVSAGAWVALAQKASMSAFAASLVEGRPLGAHQVAAWLSSAAVCGGR